MKGSSRLIDYLRKALASRPLLESGAFGLLAEFERVEDLRTACRRLHEKGYKLYDAHTPFYVHDLETFTSGKASPVSRFVLIAGLAGAAAGMLLQWWVSVVAYPHLVSGKPFFSWPAFVPIMFECGVLGGALGALGGFLWSTRLPQLHHSLFNSERFERVTDDRFFISLEARDALFDWEKTGRLLRDCGALHIEMIER